MSAQATAHQTPALTASTIKAATVDLSPFRGVATRRRRAAGVAADVLMLGTVVLCIPFVILAIGTPVALVVQFLLWIVRLFAQA